MREQNNFDFLRLVAAIFVIVGHSYVLTNKPLPPELTYFGTDIHVIGVMVFFSLSGYLITASWLSDSNLPRFLVKRSLRIFPALIVVVLLTALFLGPVATNLPLSEYVRNIYAWFYLLNIALFCVFRLPGVFSANPYPSAVNGSLWSLPVEFCMYLLTPLMALGSRRRHFLVLSCAIVGFVAFDWYLYSRPSDAKRVVFYGTDVLQAVSVAIYFLCGAMFRCARDYVPRSLACAVAGFVLLTLVVHFGGFQDGPILRLAKAVLLTYAVISCAESRLLPSFNAGRFGDFSYGLYLYAFPTQQVIIQLWPSISASILAAIAAVATFPFAFASWHFVEKRMLALKPGRHAKPLEPPGRRMRIEV